MRALEVQIFYADDQVKSLLQKTNEAKARKYSFANQLNQINDKVFKLEGEYQILSQIKDQKQAEFNQLKINQNQFESNYQEMSRKRNNSNSEINQVQEQINSLKNKMSKKQTEINKLRSELQKYELIIAKGIPDPIYKTGHYCRNGHENCVELPNNEIRTVMINQDEIKQASMILQDAHNKKREILTKLNDLKSQFNNASHNNARSEEQLKVLISNRNQSDSQLKNMKYDLDLNKLKIQQQNQSYQATHNEMNNLMLQVNNTREQAATLNNDFSYAEQQLSFAEKEYNQALRTLKKLVSEYKSLKENPSEEQQLYELAKQEIQAENSVEEEKPKEWSLNNLKDSVKDFGKETNKVAGKVLKNAATELSKANGIWKTISKNVKDINKYQGDNIDPLIDEDGNGIDETNKPIPGMTLNR